MHKKILAALAVLSCLLLPRVQANDIEPSKEFYTAIHRGTAPVVVDGNLSEWTGVPILSDPKFAIPKGSAASGTYVLWEALGGTWTGPDDQTSAVEVVWDADNVYLGFIVTDDYHENAANSAWNGDSVQLMVTKADRAGAQGVGFFLYNFALGGTEDALNDPSQTIVELEAPAANADVAATVRRDTAAKKTYYEIRMAASALGLTGPLTAGTKFGLGMAINDGDLDAPGQKGWGGLGAHAIVFGKTPSETALVTLSDATPGTDKIFLSAVNPALDKFTFRVNDMNTSISDPSTVKLLINGVQVTTTATAKTGGAFDVTYTPAAPFAPGSKNTYAIEVKDGSGQIASDSGNFNTPQYGLLTSADKVTPDTTKPGFIFKIHQNGKFTDNTYARTVNQLAGNLGPNLADPNAVGPALAAATPNSAADTNKPITFEVATVINMNIDPAGDPQGNIQPDDQFPGTPGFDPGTATTMLDGIAADVVTYVELTKGMHTLIVNSDDGFRLFVGKVNDVFARSVAGGFEGGRGATDSPVQVFAPEDGVYAVRVLFEQGGGGGNLEILEQKADTTKVLLNDTANGGPKTYRAATGAAVSGATVITSVTPVAGSTGVNGGGQQSVVITEGTDTVDLATVQLRIDGNLVSATPTKTGSTITLNFTPVVPLAAGTMHTNRISFTAGGVARSESWSYKTTLFGPGTLFIEAEDWNFEHGKAITDQPIGMTGAYAGGAFQDKGDGLDGAACDGSDFGIDYLDNNSGTDQAVYRPTTPMEAGKRNGPAGLDRGTFLVDVNHVVGWTGSSEWMNYTREFPAISASNPGTYNVYARMAHGDSTQRRGGILFTVQGDTTLCAADNQTTTELGRFSAPWTGGWDTWPDAGTDQDAIIKMKDAVGAPAIVKISGHQTVRFQFAEGAGDIDFLAFVPVNDPIPPKVVSATPAPSAVTGSTPTFNATIQNQDLKVTAASLKLDGAAVGATVNITATGGTVSYTPAALAAGSAHTYLLSITDDRGTIRETTIPFTISNHPFPNGTLFIEAEDFNFEHGKTDTTNPIGMTGPYNGGTFFGKGDGLGGADCDGTDFGIDYHDNNSTSDQAIYRANTPVEAGKLNGPAGFGRQLFDVKVNHVIGWTGSDEWMNYTRDFPADKFYTVYARMAHGDANARRGGVLFKVSGDTTLCAADNQTTEELGHFSAPWTGGWDTWPDANTDQDALIQMVDAAGSPAVVKLGGHLTLRFQYAEGAGDFDYLAFLPADVSYEVPKVLTLTPSGNGAPVTAAITATIQDSPDATVGTVTLTLDGASVTPTVTKAGNVTTVRFTPTAAFAAGSSHAFQLTYGDSKGGTTVKDGAFKATYTPLPTGTLFIEAEDFNFEHGKTDTTNPIGMTGPYDGGTFQGKGNGLNGADCDGTDFGIDYHENNATTDAADYRPQTPVEAAKLNGPAGFNRGTFDVKVNHVVGWTDGSEWMNYTREFPAAQTQYKVFARMAHGDTAQRRGGILFTVQGDTTLCATDNQTTTQLGTFDAPWTGGWDSWPDAGTDQDGLIPMKDAGGAVAVVTLGGHTTIRFQYAGGAGDFDYLAFVPQGPVGPAFTAVTRNANGSITVTWTGGGVLESTAALVPGATWTAVPGATSPFTFTPQAGVDKLFARVRVPSP